MGNCWAQVQPDEIMATEYLGAFEDVKGPGCYCFGPKGMCMNTRTMSTRLMEIQVDCETKTEDNVFVKVSVAVQYEVLKKRAKDAFYKLSNPRLQINSYVTNLVRAQVPRLTLDQTFAQKDDLAMAVEKELKQNMEDFGFFIHTSLVTDIDPAHKVKQAMNDINAAKRQRVAATERAEAENILMVKAAEAEAESKFLQGQGIAKQRAAIVDGLKHSLSTSGQELSADKVTELLLITQYFDTLEKMANGSAATVFMPHSSGSALRELSDSMRQGVMEGKVAPIGKY